MNNRATNLILFIFSPFLSLFKSISDLKRGNLSALYYIGAFIARFCAYLPPTSDAYRYRELFYQTTDFNLNLAELYVTQKDFLYSFLSWTLNSMGVPFEVFKFILLFVSISAFFWMCIDAIKTNPNIVNNKKILILAATATIFSIRYFTIAYGLRFGTASTLIVVAIYLFYKHSYTKAIILYLLCCSMHFSMLMFIPIIGGAWLLKIWNPSPTIRLICIVGSYIAASSILGQLLEQIMGENELLDRTTDAYITGFWGEEATSQMSFNGLMFSYIRIFPIFPLAYFVLSNKKTSVLKEICFLLTLFLCITHTSITLLLRYSAPAISLAFVLFLLQDNHSGNSISKFKIILASFLIVLGSYIYALRANFPTGYQYLACLSPITLATIDFSYSNEWVYTHIDTEGYIR